MLRSRTIVTPTTPSGGEEEEVGRRRRKTNKKTLHKNQFLKKKQQQSFSFTTILFLCSFLFIFILIISILSLSNSVLEKQQQQQQQYDGAVVGGGPSSSLRNKKKKKHDNDNTNNYDNECKVGKSLHHTIRDANVDDLEDLQSLCSKSYHRSNKQEPKMSNEIDWYHEGSSRHDIMDYCFTKCLDIILDEKGIDTIVENDVYHGWLLDASKMGLIRVVTKLLELKYDGTLPNLDPLLSLPENGDVNTIQEAIRGGYADIVKVLTHDNPNMVIDKFGRTVTDYIQLKGSPIRPNDAQRVLGNMEPITIMQEATSRKMKTDDNKKQQDSGWSQATSAPLLDDDSRCDIDIITDTLSRQDFFKNYFMTGRPFILRHDDAVPQEEMIGFSKHEFTKHDRFPPNHKWKVGPTTTNQHYCKTKMTLSELESGQAECKEMPGVPMQISWELEEMEDFHKVWPMYNHHHHEDDSFYKRSSFSKMVKYFGPQQDYENDFVWHLFIGGDGSGQSLYWNDDSGGMFDTLYVGTKEWRLIPPFYRGQTGMSAKDAQEYLDNNHEQQHTLQCIQQAGDVMYIPEKWGYNTVAHGFTMSVNVILSKDYHQYKNVPFFFVHINKTGGTSLIEMLRERCWEHFYEDSWGDSDLRTFHATASSFIHHYGRAVWDSANITFTTVRHPLARQVSNFFFLVDRCDHGKTRNEQCELRLIPKLKKDLTDDEKLNAFHEWTYKLYQAYPKGHPHNYLFGSRPHGNDWNSKFNCTQTSWLIDDHDKIVVKNIMKLENIDEHLDQLSNSIPCLGKQRQHNNDNNNKNNIELIKENITPKYPKWTLFSKNETTRKIIMEMFDVDFMNFGYKMP